MNETQMAFCGAYRNINLKKRALQHRCVLTQVAQNHLSLPSSVHGLLLALTWLTSLFSPPCNLSSTVICLYLSPALSQPIRTACHNAYTDMLSVAPISASEWWCATMCGVETGERIMSPL